MSRGDVTGDIGGVETGDETGGLIRLKGFKTNVDGNKIVGLLLVLWIGILIESRSS